MKFPEPQKSTSRGGSRDELKAADIKVTKRHAIPIDSIEIGQRQRRDLGDIDALAESISAIGLLHPIVTTPRRELIAGQRRIEAAKRLGWSEIPVRVLDLQGIVRGEFAENVERKDFTPTEAVAIKRALQPVEEAAAKKRQAASGGRGRAGQGNLPEATKGRAADKAARATGKGRRTVEKAEKIVEAAEADPAKFGDLLPRLDEPGARVDRIFREFQQRQERASYEARKERGGTVDDLAALAASAKKFSVIYADPPWQYRETARGGIRRTTADRHYQTQPLDFLQSLPVQQLAADDCSLFLWGLWPQLRDAFEIIDAWGFTYINAGFVWVKQNRDGEGLFTGLGHWTRGNTEPCLFAKRGSPLRLAEDVDQVIMSPIGKHSEKPEEARTRIERLFAGPYLELFGRKAVDGWHVWGDEVQSIAA